MRYVPDFGKLRGCSVDEATCFGMPHVGAYYGTQNVKSNHLDAFASCAVCGESAANSHHEPPLGIGSRNKTFQIITPRGHVTLRPALFALCGSGTTGCHGSRHLGRLQFVWQWHHICYGEQWWNGELLTNGFEPHDPQLYALGCWRIYRDGKLIKEIHG